MIRIELAIPAAIAVVLATMATVASHREGIRTEFLTQCQKSASPEACQAKWWESPLRANWTSQDIWACWAGNPRTCVEFEASEAREFARRRASKQ